MQNVCSERQIVNTIGISILYNTYVEYLYFLWYFYIIKQLKMQKPSISIVFLNSTWNGYVSSRNPGFMYSHVAQGFSSIFANLMKFQSRIRQNFEK